VDGTFDEAITITYEIDPISGVPLKEVNASYSGPDSSISWPNKLALKDALQIIAQWEKAQIRNSKSK
jgi:hypothetical protein